MADPICRWRNPYVNTIIELVKVLPHEVMSSDQFRTIVEKRWPGFLHTPYQLACQVGLYYESDEGIYYPRFDHDIDETEAFSYMKRWITRYYVPNPYTKSLKTLQHLNLFWLPLLAIFISTLTKQNCTPSWRLCSKKKLGTSILSQMFLTYIQI